MTSSTTSRSDTSAQPVLGRRFCVLVVDESENRLEAMSALLGKETQGGEISFATNPGKAWKIASQLDRLDMYVANIPAENEEHIFGLRDNIVQRFGEMPGAFYGDVNLNNFFRWIHGEQLFFQPLDDDAFVAWLHAVRRERGEQIAAAETPLPITVTSGPPLPSGISTATTEVAIPEANTSPSPDLGPLPESASVPAHGPVAADEFAEADVPVVDQAPVVDPAATTAMPEDEGPLPAGTGLGDYDLTRLIESNEDWALYDAEQKGINRTVNLKALHRYHRRDPDKVGALFKEAQARALVNHPAIALVYEANQENGVNFYARERVDDPSLTELGDRGEKLSDRAVIDFLSTVADAVIYLVENRMNFRPITGDMIRVGKEGQPKIINSVIPGEPVFDEVETNWVAG